MSKTAALKKIIKSQLDAISGGTFYENAPDSAGYPYKVFELRSVDLGDMSRDDLILTVEFWDKGSSKKVIEEMADALEALLGGANLPQDEILPTFYKNARRNIQDEDKSIQRIQLEFIVQNYQI